MKGFGNTSLLTRTRLRAGFAHLTGLFLFRPVGSFAFPRHMTQRLGLILLALFTSALWAATPPNTTVVNTATASFNGDSTTPPITVTGSTSFVTASRTPATIELLQYFRSGASGEPQVVESTQCGGGALPAPQVHQPPAATLSVPSTLQLAPAKEYKVGDPIFVRVTDYDQNQNPAVQETISIMVVSDSLDTETLTLKETGVSTGVFVGYIQSVRQASNSSCQLGVQANKKITAMYTDSLDAVTTVSNSALVDPYGIVFDSGTGQAVNGAVLTLIDTATNLPANVVCDDGLTPLPQPVSSGSTTVCDPVMVAGGYRFPLVPPGLYRLQITPPDDYVFSSTVPIANLPAGFLVLGPLGNGASYGGSFPLNPGPAVRIDVPLDPVVGDLQVLKTAEKTVLSIGDFVPFSISVKNVGTSSARGVVIEDRLPLGFRYQAGSARLQGGNALEVTVGNDGRTLRFNVGNIATSATLNFRYVAEVAAGTPLGKLENIAYAVSHQSNIGRASMLVKEDLMRSKSILMGRVLVGACDAKEPKGLPNARVLLEDGTYITTDNNGNWHADNINPGTHVVQLDIDSLNQQYEPIACEKNSRFAGRTYSQFVNVRGGTLWNADFYVQAKAGTPIGPASSPTAPSPASPLSVKAIGLDEKGITVIERLPFDADWLRKTEAAAEWLHPQTGFVPAIPTIKFAVKHFAQQRVQIKVNGETPDAIRYNGMQVNPSNQVALSTWTGLSIHDGKNLLQVTITDPDGKVVLQESRDIYYSLGPSRAELVPEKSTLVADGKTNPVVAVRLYDKNNQLVRGGLNGEFILNAPYQAQNQLGGIGKEPLAGNLENKPRYEVSNEGIAFIQLAPTTQSGEVVLSFNFADNSFAKQNTRSNVNQGNQIRAWLIPGQRDWVLVGFAEGTFGHKTLSGNTQALKEADIDKQLFDKDKIAFYAKGSIKGDTLLTIAYDTSKKRANVGAQANLQQMIDPNRYYTLYADATQPRFDAASARKLYVKLERKQFYAMFGDYDTGLVVTEFSRYSRTVNGLKSEFNGEKFGFKAFATRTAQAYKRDEQLGNGTSGVYRLSSGEILENSDKIRIETRDRFHPEVVIESKSLSRFLDYEIDYQIGTLFFRAPVMSRDERLNPIYIVAEYESRDNRNEQTTAGGRAYLRPLSNVEIGTTAVHEGNLGANADLQGMDASVQLGKNSKLVAEFANSNRQFLDKHHQGQAWKVEAMHNDSKLDAKAYVREQESGFGLGQQANTENGTRKMGVDARYQINPDIQVQGQVYQQKATETDAKREVLDARVEQKINTQGNAFYGLRMAKDQISTGETLESQQALGGINYRLLDSRLNMRATTELGLNGASDFPNRALFGIDYYLNAKSILFAEQEIARGQSVSADTTRVGMRLKPWTGGELLSSVGNQNNLDANRLFASLGLSQKWQINPQWMADVAVDRVQTLKANTTPLNSNVPFSSGSINGDSTAVGMGANYSQGDWNANGRVEWRNADVGDSRNLRLGAQRNLGNGRVLAAGVSYQLADRLDSRTRKLDARLSYAARPLDNHWAWLNRLDFVDDSTQNPTLNSNAKKLINNSNFNWRVNTDLQIALQYGAKYVFDKIDSKTYSGYTDLMGAEARYNLNEKWDVGAHASLLHSHNSGTKAESLGASIGYNVFDNTWVALGYNWQGFRDSDFTGAEYQAKGVYFAIRAKFDQDTLGLNKRAALPAAVAEPTPMPALALAPEEAPPADADNKQKISLSTDMLFEFGQTDLDGLTEQGKQKLAEIAVTLKQMNDVEHITIVGHADKMNSTKDKDFNYDLSVKRSDVVQRYLVSLGVAKEKLENFGFGDGQPVKTDCRLPKGVVATAKGYVVLKDATRNAVDKLIDCLSPNRRVVIEITGAQNAKK